MRRLSAIALAATAFALGCDRPPLHVTRVGDLLRVDVQTLGEYKTSVQRVRLSRGTEVIWEVMARSDHLQIHRFDLNIGVNSATPPGIDAEDFALVVPRSDAPFRVDSGVEYQLEIWGTRSQFSRASVRIRP